jgi:two-component system chemotaxis sensor kinase CheA
VNAEKYRELFIAEGEAHNEALSRSIMRLEETADAGARRELINEIFRSLHSMKGMAASMGYDELGALCHRLEELASDVRDERMAVSRELADLWLQSVDGFAAFVKAVRDRTPPPPLAALLARAGEFTSGPAIVHPAPRDRVPPTRMPVPEPLTSVRVKISVLDELLDLADELVVAQTKLGAQGEAADRLSAAVREIHEHVMALRVVPFASIAERYPRVVRDAARSAAKLVELEVVGGNLELDRALLEAVDPVLIHLLLNAVDHGIEPQAQRAPKNSVGRITLSVEQSRDGTVIRVRDDGAGLDHDKLRSEAERRGLVVPKGDLAAADVLTILASPGFSTKTNVSSTSGRGVGMDVVRTTVESLGGHVAVETRLGASTTFSLHLPASLALLPVLRIEHGGAVYGLPLRRVSATTAWTPSGDVPEVAAFRGKNLPLFSLSALLGSAPTVAPRWMVVMKGEPEFAVLLEQIVDVTDVVVKKVGAPMGELALIEGAAILPDGRPMLVLDLARAAGRS